MSVVQPGDYKTKCGFDAKVFISRTDHYTTSSNYDQAIGAILIPNHPLGFPGWEACEWNCETGRCLNRDDYRGWDLECL